MTRRWGVVAAMSAGFAALALLDGVAPLAAFGWVLAGLGPHLSERWPGIVRLGEVGTALAVVAAAVALGFGFAPTTVMASLLAYLQVHRRTTRQGSASDRVTLVIAALMLVTAAGEHRGVLLLPCLATWALALPVALLSPVHETRPPVVPLVLATAGLATLLFVLVPRRATMGAEAAGAGVTGFTPEVRLGELDALLDDPTVVFRASIMPLPEARPYWRGLALDGFDGTRWRSTASPGQGGPPPLPTLPRPPSEAGWTVDVQMVEAPDGVLFVPGVLRGYAGPDVRPDGQGGWVGAEGEPLAWVGWVTPFEDRAAVDLPGPVPMRGTVDPRIEALAREVAGSGPPADQVVRLTDHLRDTYPYARRAYGGEDPLVAFLFERQGGHCEYFASALAVMVRAIGLPSRVVNGYVGGEQNPITGHWVVRKRDAHSWVEVQVPGHGWVLFDPTPVQEPASQPSSAWALSDAARAMWQATLTYDAVDQRAALGMLRQGATGWVLAGLAMAGLGFGVGWVIVARWPRSSGPEAAPSRWVALHRRVKRSVERHLDRPLPEALPPRAASAWVAERVPPHVAQPYAAFVDVLYDAVIGGRDDEATFAEARRLAVRIGRLDVKAPA